MSKYILVIVESPSKARTIEKYLGKDYKVVASKGHILDLPKKELGIDTTTFKCDLVTIPGKESIVKDIVQLSKDASMIYLASDPDREGEAIAAHLNLKIKRKDTKRALFHEITKSAIQEALKNAKEIDTDKYDAQQARRIIDRLVGYKVSPVLWKKLQGGLSAGRVQSVALRIIVIREREILNFVSEKWFDVIAPFKKDNIDFVSKYVGSTPLKALKIKDQAEVDRVLQDIKNKEFEVTDLEKKERITNPQPPYTTSKLQQDASSKLKMKSKDTMAFAQKLYEAGFITYMRTDSVRTEPESLKKLREMIGKVYGVKYLSETEIQHKQKKSDSKVQDAHEAIRPTSLDNSPEKMSQTLNKGEYELYKLIYDKFAASQMASSKSEVTTVTLKAGESFFKVSGSVLVFDGFKKVGLSEDANEAEDSLPKLKVGDKLSPSKDPYSVSKESSPPLRYNEGGLIKELEEKGVGRPSTYAAIISNITDKGYVSTGKDERFVPTEIGSKLCTFLEEHFPIHVDIAFTAKTEELLDDVEEGKIGYKKVLDTFLEGLEKEIAATTVLPSIPSEGGGKTFVNKLTEHICKTCGKPMCIVDIKGKDKFLSCSAYPACKFSCSYVSPNAIPDCPKCKKGILSERKTKNGDPFVGCSTYPAPVCGFVAWNSKLIKCKHCKGKIITLNKEGKKVCYDCKKEQVIKKEKKQ
jgi:DNA topoisomerase-1